MTSITDRTKADVINQTAKGSYDYTDLNRVNANIAYIAGLLNAYGYCVSVSPKTDWTISDIPTPTQMARYIADITAIKSKFYGTTTLPSVMDNLTFTDANNIEILLAEIDKYIKWMVAGFRRSGTGKCGQGVILA